MYDVYARGYVTIISDRVIQPRKRRTIATTCKNRGSYRSSVIAKTSKYQRTPIGQRYITLLPVLERFDHLLKAFMSLTDSLQLLPHADPLIILTIVLRLILPGQLGRESVDLLLRHVAQVRHMTGPITQPGRNALLNIASVRHQAPFSRRYGFLATDNRLRKRIVLVELPEHCGDGIVTETSQGSHTLIPGDLLG